MPSANKQALARAQAALGSTAVVERTETRMGDAVTVVWRVGVKGHDLYSWAALGVSETFEHALNQAVRHQGGKR
jgi:hypothetical protein